MTSQLRVRPRIWIGFLIWIGYCAVTSVVQALMGVPYPDFGTSGGNLFRGAGVSLIVGAILLAITTSLLGWWRPALFDRRRSAHRWPIIAPIAMAVLAVLNLIGTDWGSYDLAFFGASIVLLLVGFTEELTNRGLLVVALRSRLAEGWVWFLSTLAFALMHYLNVLGGQAFGPTTVQVGFAFLGGTIFYVLRRVTGSLVWAMVLHGVWDFSTFAAAHGTISPLSGVVNVVYPLFGALALISLPWVIRGAQERTAGPASSSSSAP